MDIVIEYSGDEDSCPEWEVLCPKHDNRKKRTWRHLDTMQLATYLLARFHGFVVKRMGLKQSKPYGQIKTVASRCLFEAFAIRVLTAACSVEVEKC